MKRFLSLLLGLMLLGAAIAVGLLLGMTLEECVRGLRNFAPEGMRQKITSVKGMTFIEDCYNANLDSMCAALETLKSLKIRRTVAVLGDMLELGDYSETAHRDVGKYAAESKVDILYTCGEQSLFMADSAKKAGLSNVLAFTDKNELNFTLLSDTELEIIQAYGVWQEKKMCGKVSMGVVRTTFIINENGMIEK